MSAARIGYLARSYIRTPWQYAFMQGMRDLGYVEGENLTVEYRWAEEDDARLPDLAVELVQSQVELIVTETVVASEAAKQVTSTVPIVQAYGGELVVNLETARTLGITLPQTLLLQATEILG